MDDCIFCKIVAGKIPAKLVHEDKAAVAFADLHPKAPHHYLIIPRQHIESLSAIDAKNRQHTTTLLEVAATVAKKVGIAESGFRVAINSGPDSGQEVKHLHLHLLGGRRLNWPPG